MNATRYILGIDLGGSRLRFILADSEEGKITDIIPGKSSKVSYDSPLNELRPVFKQPPLLKVPDKDKVAVYVIRKIEQYIGELEISKEEIVSIGISVAGRVLHDHRFIGSNVPLKFTTTSDNRYGVQIVPLLRKAFPHVSKIAIENDGNCSALAQAMYYKSIGVDPSSTFFITVSTGIGGGSPRADFDEVGHVQVDGYFPPLVPPCGCGSDGCIEAYASGPGIRRQAESILNLCCHDQKTFEEFNTFEKIRTRGKYNVSQIVEQSLLKQLYLKKENLDAKDIFRLSNISLANSETDRFARYLVEIAAERFAKVLLSISNIHGVERFGVGGAVVMNNPDYLKIVKEKLYRVYKSDKDIFRISIEVEVSPLGDLIADYGALSLVIDPENEKTWMDTIVKLAVKNKPNI